MRSESSFGARWDVRGEYAREIQSSDAEGLSGKRITATVVPAQAALPWDTVTDYAARDYSDLLD